MYAFSSTGENGTGQSGAVIRRTGPSRSSNASSAIVAAISAPKPPVCVSSWRTSAFDVLRTLSSTASRSQGMTERRSTISIEMPFALELLRRLGRRVHHRPPGDDRHVVAFAVEARLADRDGVALFGHLALDAAVQVLVLEEEHGVRVLDGRDEQALRVLRRRRADALEAGDVGERALRVLRVERPAREAAAGRQPDDDRHRRSRAVALLRGHGHEVVPGAGDEVRELHLRHRAACP